MIHLTELERAALVAEGVELGFTAQVMNESVDRLLAAADRLTLERSAAEVARIQNRIDNLTTFRNRVLMGRRWVVDNAPENAVKTDTLQAIDEALDEVQRRINRLQKQIAAVS